MRRDDELAAMIHEPLHEREHGKLALRRERRFGFVEKIEPVALQPVQQEREKGFAVRLLVQRSTAKRREAVAAVFHLVQLLEFRRHIVKTLRAQEPSVTRIARPREPQRAIER